MKLSILICTVVGRETSYKNLVDELELQKSLYNLQNEVEIIPYKDNCELLVGTKRNLLKRLAKGYYICYIDDDDMVSRNYLKCIFEAMSANPDIITFNVQKYLNGIINDVYCPNVYIGSLTSGNYIFMTNLLHLCPHKKELADKIEFTDKNFSEDFDYSISLANLKPKENRIDDILYHYYFSQENTLTQN